MITKSYVMGLVALEEDRHRHLGQESSDLVQVTFFWFEENGNCYVCGLPAAFYLPFVYVREGEPEEAPTAANKRCAICAANDAADGDIVRRLFLED